MGSPAIEVLKWIGVVLAAGFVGYFGRYLAMLLIERVRRRKTGPAPATGPAGESPASPEERLSEAQLKVEKKRAKAEAKRAKKEQNN
jgi:hypothetical protein